MNQRTFDQALRDARSILLESVESDDQRMHAGAVVAEIDNVLARRDEARPGTRPPIDLRAPLRKEVEELRREVERLQILAVRERGLLRAILTESPHGILVCDQNGKIIVQNRAAERIWAGSATAESMEGWGKYRAFHPDGRPFAPSDWSMARCLRENQIVEAEEVHFQRFDGTHGMLLGSCAPIHAVDDSLLGAVCVFADITELKQIERLKDRWVALAGHEIRSPLHVLKARLAMASEAIDRGRTVDVPALIRVLQQQVCRLESLVNDMLDVSRAQAGNLHVEAVAAPLTQLVVRVAELIVSASQAHALSLDVEEVNVIMDPARTEQVITNLLNNAIQYSPRGGRIAVRVGRREREALVEVSDQGVGFEPAQAQRLFEPFLQLSRETRRAGGLGLGLYLSRELLGRMKGRIWASSAGKGQGATFSFTLPLAS